MIQIKRGLKTALYTCANDAFDLVEGGSLDPA
jgi:hypothetical protein